MADPFIDIAAYPPQKRSDTLGPLLMLVVALGGALLVTAPVPLVAQPTLPDSARVDTLRLAPIRVDTAAVAWTRRLPAIAVVAQRPSLPVPAPQSARVQTLDARAIDRSGAATLDDLLALRSSAFIKQYGANGLGSLSLRGMGASQTVVLLDGMRIADPQTGQVDLSLLPTLLLESVSIEHGAGSARYGSGSLGGTVHLRTLQPSTAPELRVQSGGGAFGERHASAVVSDGVSTASGTWSGLVAGRAYTSDGDFSYTNRFLVPQQTVRRNGAGADVRTVYGRTRWQSTQAAAHRWSLSGWWTHARRGLPGPANARATGAEQTDRQGRLWLTGHIPVRDRLLHVRAQGTASALRFVNPPAAIDRTTHTRTGDVAAWTTWPLHAWGTLDTGASVGADYASLRGGVHETTTAVFVDGTATVGPLRVEPALRLDALHRRTGITAAVSPRLGLSLPLPGLNAVRLKALAARAFRAPTFNERYYDPGGRPDLAPEDGWSTELGLHAERARSSWHLRADVIGFRSVLTDKIVWQPGVVTDGVQVWRPDNVSRVVTHGLEISAEGAFQPTSALTMRLGTVFTHTRAENRANRLSPAYGSQLPYVPEQQWKLWTHAEAHGVSLGASARLVGTRFYTADESQHAAPYQVVDLTAGYAQTLAGLTLRLSGELHNLLDERYDVIRLYPMPPRHASVRLSVSLSP